MEVAVVCFVISALLIIPITVVTLLDLLRTRKWVRTAGWQSILDAAQTANVAHVKALLTLYWKDLHGWQRRAAEVYLAWIEHDWVLEKLADAGREKGARLGAHHDSAWMWTETVAPPGEPGGNPEPK